MYDEYLDAVSNAATDAIDYAAISIVGPRNRVDRITGRLDAFSPNSTKIHIDIDPSSINKVVKVDLGIVGDCAYVLEDMVRLWRSLALKPRRSVAGPGPSGRGGWSATVSVSGWRTTRAT